MADRPIIFSAPMVRALMDGRKTQTRRVLCQFDPDRDPPHAGPYIAGHRAATWTDREGTPWRYPGAKGAATGDRLWVREAVCWVSGWGWRYRADNDDLAEKRETGEVSRWRPSIHMPRWASRLTLTVTDVRVQRLADLTDEDAIAEGIERLKSGRGFYDPTVSHAAVRFGEWTSTARQGFCRLWNSLHGPGAWDANPWVVALTFTVQRGNIDQMPGAK